MKKISIYAITIMFSTLLSVSAQAKIDPLNMRCTKSNAEHPFAFFVLDVFVYGIDKLHEVTGEVIENFPESYGEKLKNTAYVTYDPALDRIRFIYHNEVVQAFLGTKPGESVEMIIENEKIKCTIKDKAE